MVKAEVIKLYSIFLTCKIQPYIYIHIFACENIYFFKYILYLINNFLAFYYFCIINID